jgi:hypothetical protein
LEISYYLAHLLDGCPVGYQEIMNGCYKFYTEPTGKDEAKEICESQTTEEAKVHLIALETRAETVTIKFWIQGLNYTNHFWTDGMYNIKNDSRLWNWNSLDVEKFNDIESRYTGYENVILQYTSDKGIFIMGDIHKQIKLPFICEASSKLQIN